MTKEYMTLNSYLIENTKSGTVLGVYLAYSKEDALELLAEEAGYDSYQHAQEVAPAIINEILVTEIEDN